MPLEHPAEHEGAQDVLAAADDAEERVELGTPRGPLEAVVPAGEDVEGQREPQVHRCLVERAVDGIVVVGHRGIARHHDASQSQRLDAPKVGDAVRHRAHRGLAHADEAIGVRATELGDPEVIGVEAGLLVVEVGVIADHHPYGGIDDLRRDPVAVLIGEAGVGIPAAAVQLLEADAPHGQLARVLTRRRDEPHGYGLGHAVDHEDIASLGVPHDVRRAVAEAPVDAVHVGARRLGHVRVGGDDRGAHGRSPRRRGYRGSAPAPKGVGASIRPRTADRELREVEQAEAATAIGNALFAAP
jgi:hypothetical protein